MVNAYSPTPIDGYSTPTSTLQASTENIIRSHIRPEGGAQPELQKRYHFEFLLRNLRQGFPERYVSQDASQPWLIYWTLHCFSILGAGLDDQTKKRGIYCLLAVATLLNLLTPELLAGVPDFLATCQTYEGGFGNASFPGWAFEADDPESETGPAKTYDPSAPRPPLGEAHGGYTFCATASWVLLRSFIDLYYAPAIQSSAVSLPQKPHIDTRALLRWCTQMQGLPIELGGFKGRTNKLVDGCYSWWVGGCFVLVEALLGVGAHSEPSTEENAGEEEGQKSWDDIDDSLFDRKALQEYILLAGQHPAGGLRDKPPKPADAYHTLYCSAGLSAAQHRVIPSEPRRKAVISAWDAAQARARDGTGFRATSEAEREKLDALRRQTCAHVLSWAEEEGTELYVGGATNRVNATHPLFNLTTTHSDTMMAYFYGQTFPSRHFTPAKK
ncbi:Protein farnesyltransferase subunit beta [Trametes pubescens]|uniref:Protein farnesyltransferase subunit beta n=1 Tax=Trametes pubescens TaxID=154538 RepID=A0A1M2VCX1_TRAPU|nr:Protein farnesyltransferase subunit beta [Trametes pubescens]